MNPLIKVAIANTLKFDQYSRLAILLNIFRFLKKKKNLIFGQKFRKLIGNSKKSFSLVCRAR